MDAQFSDLFMVDTPGALRFFAASLGEVIERGVPAAGSRTVSAEGHGVSRDEFLYVSSILAHYALVEAGSAEFLPIPGTLRDLHDLFVTNFDTWQDPELMETAAAQALMLTGYFAGAMRQRHNLNTYVTWGRFFFGQAASGTRGRKHAVLEGMHRHFPVWRDHLERLHTELWERRLLLDVSRPSDARLVA